MKLMVIGSGGREHAIIRKLKDNKDVEVIYALPGNDGMSEQAVCVNIAATDIEGMVKFAKDHAVDYAVVTPDNPLALGAVDALEQVGIPCFGPTKDAAIIEASKAFSKELMKKYHIPTASYETFSDVDAAISYIKEKGTPIVIKADGLALGKGVVIAMKEAEANEAVKSMLEDEKFGDAGHTIVIEEYMEGPEVSVLCFTDGKTLKPMVSSMDHKRAHDHDEGLNTGGMGAIAPNPYYTEAIASTCMDLIYMPTLRAMEAEGRPFKGCLYFALMLTKDGPRVIEYNARFGDPETQAVLPLLKSDLLTIMMATTNGTLDTCPVEFTEDCACCVVVASEGYPLSYEKGNPITVKEEVKPYITYAGVKEGNGRLTNHGGRVLNVTRTAQTLPQAIEKAYESVQGVSFANAYCRKDIGQRALFAWIKEK